MSALCSYEVFWLCDTYMYMYIMYCTHDVHACLYDISYRSDINRCIICCRMAYSGSILNPQAAPAAPFNQAPLPQQTFSPKPVAFSPPAAYPHSSASAPLSPPVKQAAPKPWVPSDGAGGKMLDLPCGDSTAHRGTSTYYDAAPLDPSKVPVCSGCNTNIRYTQIIL